MTRYLLSTCRFCFVPGRVRMLLLGLALLVSPAIQGRVLAQDTDTPASDKLEPLQLIPSLDESEISSLLDFDSWNPNSAVIHKILHRFKQMEPYLYDRINLESRDVFEKRISSRVLPKLQRFRIEGTLKSAKLRKLTPQAAELYEYKTFWELDLAPDHGDALIRVAVRKVPRHWIKDAKFDPSRLGDQVGIDGLMVYDFFVDENSDQKVAVFAAPEIKWYPSKPGDQVNEGLVVLAAHGVDAGSFDRVANTNGRNLGSSDSETFFQMLAATRTLQNESRSEPALIDIAEVFRNPHDHYGSRMKIRGRLRRITPVDVNPERYGKRFGVKRYYQLDIFVKINGRLRIVSPATGEALVFDNDFPVSVCVTSLPDFLQDETRPSEDIELEAFYFKFWSYHSANSRREGDQLQSGPLLVGLEPQKVVYDPPGAVDWILNTVIGVIVIGVVLGGLLMFLQRKRSGPNGPKSSSIDLGALQEAESKGATEPVVDE